MTNPFPIMSCASAWRCSRHLTASTQQLTTEQKRIRSQILELLEDEKLQLQEAVKKNITVSPVEVDKRINAHDRRNITSPSTSCAQILTNAGASEDALRSQITAQIAWQKTVQDEYADRSISRRPRWTPNWQRYAEGANKPHYHGAAKSSCRWTIPSRTPRC